MSFTYDPRLTLDRDRMRLDLGDTQEPQPLLQDEELDVLLGDYALDADLEPSDDEIRQARLVATAKAADIIAAKFARDVDTVMPEQRVGLSQRYQQYRALAKSLREDARRIGAVRAVRW